MSDENGENDGERTLEKHAGDLRRRYKAVGTLAEKKPLYVSATDLRHALGRDSPAKSLSKGLMVAFLAEVTDRSAGDIAVDSDGSRRAADEIRADMFDVLEATSESTSLGPHIYRMLAAIERANPRYSGIETIAPENSVEDDFEPYLDNL